MPSFADSVVIFVIALILFGPKKLPQLARQLGKLMGEFRRASNDFRMQMEEELRLTEQEEAQKKVEAISASTQVETYPVAPEYASLPETTDPVPIAESGEIKMMPPSTGLPEASSFGKPAATSNAGIIATEDHSIGAIETAANGEPDLMHG